MTCLRESAKDQADKNLKLLLQKNADYGTQNIEMTGPYGVAVRLQDKVSRLLNLLGSNNTANFESVEDTFQDVANYGLIGQLLLQGKFTSSHSEDKGEDVELDREPVELRAARTVSVDSEPPTNIDRATVDFSFKEDPTENSEDVFQAWGAASSETNRMVYLCGPIDMVEREQATGWRERVAQGLSANNIASFNPAAAIQSGHHAERSVVNICRSAVHTCDALIARLPADQLAFGSIREIEIASQTGIPIVLLTDWAGFSAFSFDCTLFGLDEEDTAVRYLRSLLTSPSMIDRSANF